MRWATLAGMVAAAAVPAVLHAQDDMDCSARLDEVAAQIPDLSETPDAPEVLGISEAQHQAVLATLDAARLVRDDDPQGCMNLVEAAASILESGEGDQ